MIIIFVKFYGNVYGITVPPFAPSPEKKLRDTAQTIYIT